MTFCALFTYWTSAPTVNGVLLKKAQSETTESFEDIHGRMRMTIIGKVFSLFSLSLPVCETVCK